ncbi:hypothetical protein DM558_03930 [Entomomonas moraniae]|uniref:Com family DNA-binding transcriptional regulator n=1 Tax=Entomomonas moraniae TaxID=2213226 RepID=A0A3S9XC60_9GAMM|nr:hypothetical protein DM558_03930 [Entomomonas moraniae]
MKNKTLEIDGSYQYKCDSCGRLFFKVVDSKVEIKCTQCKKMHYKPMSLNNRNAEQRSQPMELVDSSN